MRYRHRPPYKVKPHMVAAMRAWRAAGKSYAAIGELLGVSRDCARKWLTGQTPAGSMSSNERSSLWST